VAIQQACSPEGNVKLSVSRANLFEDSFQQVTRYCAIYHVFLSWLSHIHVTTSLSCDILLLLFDIYYCYS